MSHHSYISPSAPLDCILLPFISHPYLYSFFLPSHKSICFAEPCENVQHFIHTRERLCKVPHEWFLERGYKMIKVLPGELLLMSSKIPMVTFYSERSRHTYKSLHWRLRVCGVLCETTHVLPANKLISIIAPILSHIF